jgi:hypothetical protein
MGKNEDIRRRGRKKPMKWQGLQIYVTIRIKLQVERSYCNIG